MQRTFLITGASKGIGLALAHNLVKQGQRVIGLARNRTEDFPGTLVQADLADSDATARLCAELAEHYDFDGVVNNVGFVGAQPLEEVSLSVFDEVMRVNLHPAVLTAQALLPGMRARGWGRIVNISSLTALGAIQRTAYAAAKSALISFSRGWALELATTGITVNTVAPGPTETELFRANNTPGSDGEKRYLSGIPMKRFGRPEEVAAAIAFVLSEDASFMTGQTLHIDGGASIGRA